MLKKTKLAAALLMAALALAGCGGAPQESSAQDGATGTPAPAATQMSIKDRVQGAKPEAGPTGQTADTPTPEPAPTGAPTPTIKPTATPEPTPTNTPTPTPKPTATPTPALDDIDAIAALARLVGDQSLDSMYTRNVVNVDTDANPYDLTWRYGPTSVISPMGNERKTTSVQSVQRDDWDDEWQSYVDACDWSLVFDIGYYEETFPLLAELYCHDADLLLKHYQTVGVHEGRQASAGFCPAAYMANCGTDLKAAFRDSPECYVIYYMLHYSTEKNVSTENTNSKYPKWLTVELSNVQKKEFDAINRYRTEVGVDPIEIHPEVTALACLRARIDALGGYSAHDYVHTDDGQAAANSWLKLLGLHSYGENTQKLDVNMAKVTHINSIANGYRNSELHYKAMIDALNLYVGCANMYYCESTARTVHFDCFTEALPNPGANR